MTLDISGLPAPQSIEALAYESLLAQLVAAVAARFLSDGIAYEVGGLETDPVKIVLEAYAAHEVALRARVNDAIRAVLPAFASSTDLDNIVSRTGVGRAIGESDAQLLERYLVSLARPAAGSLLAYRHRILSAWPGRGDVAVYGPIVHGRRGDIDVVLAAPAGASVSTDTLALVQAAISAADAKPLTDVVSTRAAAIATYQIRNRITVAEGREVAPIRAAALAAAKAFAEERYQIGMSIKRNAITATSYVPGVVAVEDMTSGADVIVSVDQVPRCLPSSIIIEVAN